MQLTPEQKDALVRRYDKLVCSIVWRFKRRNNSQLDNWQDLYQEAMLVLFEHIARAETLDHFRAPIRDMVNAMCRYTLSEQVVSVPRRTTDYSNRVNTVSKSVTIDTLDYEEIPRDNMEDILTEKAMISSFLASVSPQDRAIVRMRMRGIRNRDIGKRLGLSDVAMTRRLKRIRDAYLAYAA